jgi:hypothetical protein
MNTALIVLLSCASLSLAQDSELSPKPVAVKRLASVTWNADTHKLVWGVQKGAQVNGEFVASPSDQYELSPEEASMASKDEKRGMAAEDAGSVGQLVNLLSLYCAASTDWWEQGAEDTATPEPARSKNTDTKKTAPSEKPTRVGEPEQKAPARMPGTLVAANLGSGK